MFHFARANSESQSTKRAVCASMAVATHDGRPGKSET